jgi:hypothetical protein
VDAGCAEFWLAEAVDLFAFEDDFFADGALLAAAAGVAGDEALDASLAGAAELDAAPPGALADASGEAWLGCADCDGAAPDDAGLTVPALAGFVADELSAGVCGVEGVALASAGADAGEDVDGAAEALAGVAFFDVPVQSASVFTCRGK